ncbi:MAG: TetR/AcrR family transcriptional regulator [Solibacillus sp.]
MSKRQQQKLERRDIIVQAAKELILQRGIHDVQLQDVAQEAGIGIATLYRYFPNKEQLVLAVSNIITQQMTEALRAITTTAGTAYEQLECMLDYYIEFSDEPEHRFLKFFRAFEQYKPGMEESEAHAEYLAIRRELVTVLLILVEKGKQDGSLRSDIDLNVYIVTAIHNMSHFTTETALIQYDPMLPLELTMKKQLVLLKDMLLMYVRPFH